MGGAETGAARRGVCVTVPRMLLDQKRTKRMVIIVSVICALAFVGVLPVVLGLLIFGNNDASGQTELIKEAENKVAKNPQDVAALVELASRYRASNRNTDAETTLDKAVAVGAKTYDELTPLVGALADTPPKQMTVLEQYTKAHPKDAEGWALYGTIAEQSSQTVKARLAYGRALQTAPPGSQVRANAEAAITRLSTQTTPTGVTATTPGDAAP